MTPAWNLSFLYLIVRVTSPAVGKGGAMHCKWVGPKNFAGTVIPPKIQIGSRAWLNLVPYMFTSVPPVTGPLSGETSDKPGGLKKINSSPSETF